MDYEELARSALANGDEESALGKLAEIPAAAMNASLWQWTGLLQRSLDRHREAFQSFGEAARLAPNDASIAHGRARVALEAGLDAVELYEIALRLAPSDGQVLIGLGAAEIAIGQGERSVSRLRSVLAHSPLWIPGHEQLGQLLAILGSRSRSTVSLEEALARLPQEQSLWAALFSMYLGQEDYCSLSSALVRARSAGVPSAGLQFYEAVAAAELDDSEMPSVLFAQGSPEVEAALGVWRIRHLLRRGAADKALPLIDRELGSDRADAIWPYASLAWRLTGDARLDWLEGDAALISIHDLSSEIPSLERLRKRLSSLHVARGEYLDQSVRGGTQTDGPLLSRIDPEIQALRKVLVSAVGRHIAALPPIDPKHPLLRRRRDRRIRFSGSWSVRLREGGRHSNHVHPQGWISSAFYVDLPQRAEDETPEAGCLNIGEPPLELGLPLKSRRRIEPRKAHLVLFPSWMWHGTEPFASGERLTVAFDVAPPR